jgi:hypothetical protein
MKNFRIYYLAFLSLTVAFVACSDDGTDTEKPVITLNEPEDHEHFHPGDEIHFDADFSDNVALKQMKIDIHSAEGHDHKSSSVGTEWHWDTIINLSGRNMHKHFHIDIPADAEHGEYHFIVYATDAAGNESFVAIEIEIDDHD